MELRNISLKKTKTIDSKNKSKKSKVDGIKANSYNR